jgi:hypothetical protein
MEADQLRARIAELERENAALRAKLETRDARAIFYGLRILRSRLIERGTVMVNDDDLTDAGYPPALAAQTKAGAP